MDRFLFAQASSQSWNDVAKAASEAGPFGGGAIFGGWLAYVLFGLASKERIERQKNDDKRYEQLMEQLKLKDQRIEALHSELIKFKPKK